MKNKIEDLRNHLFAQMERLSDESCDLEKEVQRASSLVQVAEALIQTGEIEVSFIKAIDAIEGQSTFFQNDNNQKKLST